MKTIALEIGSPDWIKSRSASKAPAVMGTSKYQTRSELMRIMATGIAPEVDARTQARFDAGHASEETAREIAGDLLSETFEVESGETDDGYLTASFDGLATSFDGSRIGFEHKLWNESLVAAVRVAAMGSGELPEEYKWQMDQQILVGGLDYVLFMVSDGTRENCVSVEYRSTPERHTMLLAAWRQFDSDLANYQHVEIAERPKADVVADLPALFVHAKGEITTHNMDEFSKALALRLAETRAIVLVTDQDFSNAKESAKKFRETAKAIALSKDAMLAQTETIGEAARKMDSWAKDLNATALQLEKDVEREDKAKKVAMVLEGKDAYAEHVAALEREIAPIRLALIDPNFAEAIKGKRNYTSMQDAVETMLAGAKITADAAATDVRSKLAWCKEHAAGYSTLFPDLQQIIAKPLEDFALTITSRINKAKADEAARLEAERERIRQEEVAKIAVSEVADRIEINKRVMETLCDPTIIFPDFASVCTKATDDFANLVAHRVTMHKEAEDRRAAATINREVPQNPLFRGDPIKINLPFNSISVPDAQYDTGAKMNLGSINTRLGFTVSADFLAKLGFVYAVEKNAKLYREADFSRICMAIAKHVSDISQMRIAA